MLDNGHVVEGAVHGLHTACLTRVKSPLLWQVLAVSDQLHILVSLDVLLAEVGQLGKRLLVNRHMDHIVVFGKLTHTFAHFV